MALIFYEVLATARDEAAARAWVEWMRGKHLADVLAAGALTARLVQLDEPRQYAAQYTFASRADFERYIREEAPRLRAEGLERFGPDAMQYARRSGEVVYDA